VSNQIGEPLHGRFVEAHIVALHTGIPWKTRPAVVTFAKSRHTPVGAELDDLCIFRNLIRASCHGTPELSFSLFTRLGGCSHENSEGCAREEHSAQDKTPVSIHS
jgi:hypothetical protein